MAAKNIKDTDVLDAIAFRDSPENAEFVLSLGFGQATKFRLVFGGRFYDSKEIAGIAHGIATGECLSGGSSDLRGGMESHQAGGILHERGFLVDDGPLYALRQLGDDLPDSATALYQYIILLWSISRARAAKPRLVPYLDVRDELTEMLTAAQVMPDPTEPWFGLPDSSWWESQLPVASPSTANADMPPLERLAGLPDALYDRVREDESFAGAAVDVISQRISGEPTYDQLLNRLRLATVPSNLNWAARQQGAASAPSSHGNETRAFIVTWNPGKGKFRNLDYDEAIARTARNEIVEEDWSTGNTRKGVSKGDRVFMLQQGDQGRGIMASGRALGEIYPIPHWDREAHPRGIAQTVDVGWEHIVAIDDGLDADRLKRELPDFPVSTPRSGITVKGELAEQLEEMWARHLTDIGLSPPPEVADALAAVESVSNPRRQFGRRLTAAENTAIEEHAVRLARAYFEFELGYDTEDVGKYESYDVHATRDSEVVKVEVKGTTSDGAAVVLTRNEVSLHLAEHPNNALVVVRHITLDRTGDRPQATGGELTLIKPWAVRRDALSPIAYDYRTGI